MVGSNHVLSTTLHTAGLTAITDNNIQAAVDEWVAQPAIAAAKYGDIAWWDVGAVSGAMEMLFKGKSSFNEELSHWCAQRRSPVAPQYIVRNPEYLP